MTMKGYPPISRPGHEFSLDRSGPGGYVCSCGAWRQGDPARIVEEFQAHLEAVSAGKRTNEKSPQPEG